MFDRPGGRFSLIKRLTAAFLGVSLVVAAGTADARGYHHRWGRAAPRRHYTPMPSTPTDPSKDAALIVDGETGRVLYQRNASLERHPASLTKMMTLYLLFEAMRRGDVNLQTMLPISEHAASQRPTNLHLYAGDSISVETAIKAIVVRSANDVAVAIAESLGGTEGHFAEMMTDKARMMGMRDTYYHNASGLPDALQITTANDLSILARHLAYDFPQYFPYFATPYFNFRGTMYVTHDNLIGRYQGADGIKTGYTGASGFNLVSSVVRDNMHIIGVVMGGYTGHRRDMEMMRLLDQTFAQISVNPMMVARAGVPWRNVAAVAPPLMPSVTSSSYVNGNPDDEDAAEARGDQDAGGNTPNEIAAPPPPAPRTGAVVAQAQPAVPLQPVYQQPPSTQPVYTPPAQNIPTQPVPAPRVVSAVPATVASASVPIPSVRPRSRPDIKDLPVALGSVPRPTAKPSVVELASTIAPTPKPGEVASADVLPKPKPRGDDAGEGDVGDAGVAVGPKSWSIQIGAFADMQQARGQLAAYAKKSMDVLGQAARIIVPFTGVDGHTLYRARFGPFAEREAREVCTRLTARGQTCFTVQGRS